MLCDRTERERSEFVYERGKNLLTDKILRPPSPPPPLNLLPYFSDSLSERLVETSVERTLDVNFDAATLDLSLWRAK